MNRRTFLCGLTVGTLGVPLGSEAQQTGKVWRIGLLRWQDGPDANVEALRQALRDLGWIEGRNVAFEYRFAAGREDRLPRLADELNSEVRQSSSVPCKRSLVQERAP